MTLTNPSRNASISIRIRKESFGLLETTTRFLPRCYSMRWNKDLQESMTSMR